MVFITADESAVYISRLSVFLGKNEAKLKVVFILYLYSWKSYLYGVQFCFDDRRHLNCLHNYIMLLLAINNMDNMTFKSQKNY